MYSPFSPVFPTIHNLTQVSDLTRQITIPDTNAVSYGGFSDVYCGIWNHSPHDVSDICATLVAVKLPRSARRDDERSRKIFEWEVNIWKRFDHPNIAKFHGTSFEFGGYPALIIQWYNNGTAPEFLRNQPMASKLDMVKDVSRGLTYMHTLDPPIMHGDLKGNNTLVDDDGHGVLTDFGLSKIIDDTTTTRYTTTMRVGFVRWQAPELLFDEEHNDEDEENGRISDGLSGGDNKALMLASDTWSFACTAYELLTGSLPYHNCPNDYNIMLAIMRGVCPLRSEDVVIHDSAELCRLLKECWKKEPGRRPEMTEVERRLEDMVLGAREPQ